MIFYYLKKIPPFSADTNQNRRKFSPCSLASLKLGLHNLTEKVGNVNSDKVVGLKVGG